jgi:hypothetical protein
MRVFCASRIEMLTVVFRKDARHLILFISSSLLLNVIRRFSFNDDRVT